MDTNDKKDRGETMEKARQLKANLDRFMQSESLRQARDIVIEDQLLLGSHVANWLDETAKRCRQIGEVHYAEACEVRLGLLKVFRELGVQEGYLEVAIKDLAHAQTAEDHRRILRENPELASDAARDFISRRLGAARLTGDATAVERYKMAGILVQVKEFEDTSAAVREIDTTEAVYTFLRGFILESDAGAQRELLEARPDLLQMPLCLIVGSMFQPYIEKARLSNNLATLRPLLLRQALFARCQKIGVASAFRELANRAEWTELKQN
jgi:hypothetical protein